MICTEIQCLEELGVSSTLSCTQRTNVTLHRHDSGQATYRVTKAMD